MNKPTHSRRFSLGGLLLLVTLAGLVMALVAQWRTNRQLVQSNQQLTVENRRLRDEVGELSIDDEDQLHAIRVKSDGLEWRWRIWIPKDHAYRLRCVSSRIPKTGWPEGGGTMWLREAGEHVVRYTIQQDPRDEKWYGSLSTRGGSVGKDHHPWVEWGSSVSTTSGVGAVTRAFATEDKEETDDAIPRIEICRFLISKQDSTDQIEDPAAGFMIWLERDK